MKTTKIIFWISTVIIFLTQGVMPILMSQSAEMKEGLAHLGYPPYFGIMLDIFKAIGGLALIIPMIPSRIKEWAYAGMAIDFIAAFVSIVAVDGLVGSAYMAIVFMAILIVSYIYYHKMIGTVKIF